MKKNLRDRDRRRSRNAYHEARRAANDRKQEAQYRDGYGRDRAIGIKIVPMADEVWEALEAGGITQAEWDALTVVDVQKDSEAIRDRNWRFED